MEIPIIISRKNSKGQYEHYNINNIHQMESNLQKTFNPLVFREINGQNSISQKIKLSPQKTIIAQRKNSTRVRKISSSGASKRFPKDFFQLQTEEQKKKIMKTTFQNGQNNQINELFLKRRRNFSNVDPLGPKEENSIQTPKFSQKPKELDPFVIKSRLSAHKDYLSHPKISTVQFNEPSLKKYQMFKIKSTTTKTSNQIFMRKGHLMNKKTLETNITQNIDKVNYNKDSNKKKIAIINGTKVLLQKDQNGHITIKKVIGQ